MQTVINNFSQVEYLMIFQAFIYSYIATQFFSGWGRWLQNRKKEPISLNHILFSLLIFLLLVDFWWISFERGPGMTSSMNAFFVSLITPLNMSVLAFNLFPRDHASDVDMTAYFHRRGRFMFLVLAFDFLTNAITDYYLQNLAFDDMENIFRFAGVMLCVVGAVYLNPLFIRILCLAGFAVLGLHIVLMGDPVVMEAGYGFEEHLTLFITFIYGFIISRFFSGWSYILEHIRNIQFSKEHIAWTLLAFVLLIDFWWGSWEREAYITRHESIFLLSLLLPMILYGLVIVLFPFRKYGEHIQLRDYFHRNQRIILAMFGGMLLTNGILATIMEGSLASQENMFRGLGISLTVIAIFSRGVIIQRAVLIVGWALFLLHAVLDT